MDMSAHFLRSANKKQWAVPGRGQTRNAHAVGMVGRAALLLGSSGNFKRPGRLS